MTWSGGTEGAAEQRGGGEGLVHDLQSRARIIIRSRCCVSASIASSCRLAHALTSPSSSEDTRGRSVAVGWALGPQGEFERRVQAGQIVGGDCQQASALSALQRLRDRLLGENPSGLTAESVSEAEQHGTDARRVLTRRCGRGKTMLMDMFYTTYLLTSRDLRVGSTFTISWPKCTIAYTRREVKRIHCLRLLETCALCILCCASMKSSLPG